MQTSRDTKLSLIEADQYALKKLKVQARLALQFCQETTSGNVLTLEEYARASDEFRELIATPYAKGEPIYIMPASNPRVDEFAVHIQKGTPYHQFIKENYGVIWPIVLRLYYDNRISIEQMESMLKVSHWLETGLKVENVPLLDKSGQLSDWEGTSFIDAMHFPRDNTEFMRRLAHLPKGEKNLLKVTLNHDYINFARLYNPSEYLDVIAMIAGVPVCSGKYSETIRQQAASMFGALIYGGQWPHNVMVMGAELFLLLPSSTLFKIYLETMNPSRSFQYKRRLGLITPEMMETYSENNMRLGNLFAPGVAGPTLVHHKISLPIWVIEHDMYHCYFEGLLSTNNYMQMMRAKQVLRSILPMTGRTLTSEITRCIERERHPQLAEQERFFKLLEYVFAMDTNTEHPSIRNSSVIILCDMFLNPQYWPYFVGQKTALLRLLWPDSDKPSLDKWEAALQRYAELVPNDLSMLAVLMLCHFYLKDPTLALALADNHRQGYLETQIQWVKNADKHLQAVFKRDGLEYTLEAVFAWSAEKRIAELAPSFYCLERRADYDPTNLIVEHAGKICVNQPDPAVIRFSLPCSRFTKELRDALGCERVRAKLWKPGQLVYLQKSVPTITIEPEVAGTVLCTFPKNHKPLVAKVLTQWPALQQQSCTRIQKVVRGHLGRNGLFKKAQQAAHPEEGGHLLIKK